jgi:hypothetical protein
MTHAMASFVAGVGTNIVADLLVAVSLLGAAFAYHFPRRTRVRRFFGLGHLRAGGIKIVLSNIWVEQTKSVTAKHTGFQGPAGTLGEYLYATALARTIEHDASLPRLVRFFTAQREGSGPDLDGATRYEVQHAPTYVDTANPAAHAPVSSFDDLPESVQERVVRVFDPKRHTTIVLVGSHVYNTAVCYALDRVSRRNPQQLGYVTFFRKPRPPKDRADARSRTRQPQSAFFDRGIQAGNREFRRSPGTIPDPEGSGEALYRDYFLLQKIVDWPYRGLTVFVASGTSTVATVEALLLLADWRRLRAEVPGDGSFERVYEVLSPHRELPGYDGDAGHRPPKLVYPLRGAIRQRGPVDSTGSRIAEPG